MPRISPYAGFAQILQQALAGYVKGTQYRKEKDAEQEYLDARSKKLKLETELMEKRSNLFNALLPSIMAGDEGSPTAGPLVRGAKSLIGRGMQGPTVGPISGGFPSMELTRPDVPAIPEGGITPRGTQEGGEEISIMSPTEGPRQDIADMNKLRARIKRYKTTNLALQSVGEQGFYKDITIKEHGGRQYAFDPNTGDYWPISGQTAKSILDEQKSAIELERAGIALREDRAKEERGYGIPSAKDLELWVKGPGGKPTMIRATSKWNRKKSAVEYVDTEGKPIDASTIVSKPEKGKGGEGDGEVKSTKLTQARAILADRMVPFAMQNTPDMEGYGYTTNMVISSLSDADRNTFQEILKAAEKNLDEGREPAEAVQIAFDQVYGKRGKQFTGSYVRGSRPTREEALEELRRRGLVK